MPPRLILASSSRYRRDLLGKLGLAPECCSPDIDESPLPTESPANAAARLSCAKAEAVAPRYPDSLIIASDQIAELDGRPLGKPGTLTNAQQQLRDCAGRSVTFHTGLCLLNTTTNHRQVCVEPFRVRFRQLTDTQITNYLQREPALDCAGSFKSEGLGIALFSAMQGDDPNTLVGLPLIRLVDFLLSEGYAIL